MKDVLSSINYSDYIQSMKLALPYNSHEFCFMKEIKMITLF